MLPVSAHGHWGSDRWCVIVGEADLRRSTTTHDDQQAQGAKNSLPWPISWWAGSANTRPIHKPAGHLAMHLAALLCSQSASYYHLIHIPKILHAHGTQHIWPQSVCRIERVQDQALIAG